LSGTGGRDVALAALHDARTRRVFVRNACDRIVTTRAVPPSETALASELALGVVQHRLTLDHLITRLFKGRFSRLDPMMRDVMRIGAYQLVYTDRIPDFAAVDEGVEQAKRIGGRRAGGLANAVLRTIVRHRTDRRVAWAGDRDARAIRVDATTCCRFIEPVLPDPETELVTYLSVATSHPATLVKRWIAQFGMRATEGVLWCGVMRPPLILRANRLRANPRDLIASLAREGTEAIAAGEAVVVIGHPGPLERTEAFRHGLCQPQDPTAMAAVCAARPELSERMLDLCAAPGTKATLAAELRGDRDTIVASDRNLDRLSHIDQNCHRLGIRSIRTVPPKELERVVGDEGPFDLVLVDAPCSNSGVFSRRPEARYRLNERSLAALAEVQAKLLSRAASLVAPQGRIVYVTCSLEREEDEQVIEVFARSHAGWHVTRSERTLPCCGPTAGDWHDGGFTAELRRP